MSDMVRENPGAGTRPRVVLDTDTFNEIDDQFALAYLLRATDRVETEAIYAAPFFNSRSASAGDGMQKSYEEIGRLLELLGLPEFPSFRGSDRFLDVTGSGGDAPQPRPVESDAVRDLVDRSMTATHSDRLIVIAIGALTNVASALLVEPEMVERTTVVWLGGHYPFWPHQNEFNLTGDIAATRVVFDSGVPLYVVPCLGVASHLLATPGELEGSLGGDRLSQFLLDRFVGYGSRGEGENAVDAMWSKVIWDIAAVAWLVLPGAVKSFPLATPRIADDGSYIHDPRRHHCRFAYQLDRDAIFSDMCTQLGA
jgi:inosine-uridine nucleoside N-ribohydrolase